MWLRKWGTWHPTGFGRLLLSPIPKFILGLNINCRRQLKKALGVTLQPPRQGGKDWMMTDVGEVIRALGDFGRFQGCLVLLITLTAPTVAFHVFGQLLMAELGPHYCNASWFRAVGLNLTEEERLNLTIPRKPDGTLEECLMYTPVDRDLDDVVRYGLNATEKCRDGWVFPSQQKPSLATQVWRSLVFSWCLFASGEMLQYLQGGNKEMDGEHRGWKVGKAVTCA